MSLSGNLGFVSLDEVLRLLTRSDQQGAVDVSGDELHGKIFVTKGGVVLATTSDDAGMHRHLVKSGLVEEDFLNDVEDGRKTLASLAEKHDGALIEFLRELTVESLYQLGLRGSTFQVYEGVESRYASPEVFDLESLLNDAKQRLTDWTEVSRTIKHLNQTIRLRRDLGDREEVKVKADAWKVLCEIGTGSSVSEIAERLGTTGFWTARVAARLVRDDLVVLEDVHAEEPIADEVTDEYEASAEEHGDDSDESWWEEPGDEVEVETATEPEAEPTAVESAQEEESRSIFGAYKPRRSEPSPAEEESHPATPTLVEDSEPAEVEEDTEAFLEKVFSELDSDDEPEEEGYGLLRRRRLGAIREAGDTDSREPTPK